MKVGKQHFGGKSATGTQVYIITNRHSERFGTTVIARDNDGINPFIAPDGTELALRRADVQALEGVNVQLVDDTARVGDIITANWHGADRTAMIVGIDPDDTEETSHKVIWLDGGYSKSDAVVEDYWWIDVNDITAVVVRSSYIADHTNS